MFYAKNLPTIERVGRLVVSAAAIAAGFNYFGFGLYGYVIAASSVGFALTAVIGWCPMCAMAGRKLDKKSSAKAC